VSRHGVGDAGQVRRREVRVRIDPEIAKAKLDLKAVYTNDFAKKANAKYPKA